MRIVPFLLSDRPHLRGVAAAALAALGHRPAVPAKCSTMVRQKATNTAHRMTVVTKCKKIPSM